VTLENSGRRVALGTPKTREDWKRLRQVLEKTSAGDYPGTDPGQFAEFRKAVLDLTGGFPPSARAYWKWNAIGLAPAVFFYLTETVLRVAHWGAIFYFAAVAFIFVGIIRGGKAAQQAQKDAESAVVALGRTAGLLD